ncbi:RluA family pseudouridine synthase [Cupriavidus sp.]|uniref:RluA family pseudouridine synthase n=1 Tax=Cupriavidus sp. TaxID=1873897 RepID=UPI0025B84198|nr:RluA family pseudouridine synthase [Cupriavidus sp.]MCA3189425.1 RluA family pseudouridine synthase [Cupriavidus sp.]MCA3195505.1 RluA family pseudouridine synthase [Cupriavidus sp.]MCA3201060.1 RluA family pseudouridine synthase [Cupriavidus sp.]MCA3210478.1 RluA family pseudouridine synthase [Cupriavidus sp.]MCA3235495.1 RluA family pseudouridine synthase [Cupriavidus sp.]
MKKNSAKHYSRSPKTETGLERHTEKADVTDQESEDFDDPLDDGDEGDSGGEFNDEVPATAPAAPDLVPLYLEVDSAAHGERLDKLLARHFSEFSRSRIQQWIEDGAVRVDGEPSRAKASMQMGQQIEIHPQAAPESMAFTAEDVPLDVLYEDDALLVINKPAGLVVHPAAGNWSGTVLNGLLHRDPHAARLPRAGIVHRLDKETSGLMVVARTLTAQTDLVRQLQARTVKRSYIALVWGETPDDGTIDAPIGRDPRERTRMAIVHTNSGKPSRTHFETLGTVPLGRSKVSMVMCQLETGRTHQIRVHFESIGHPLVGDPVYHKATQRGQRPAVRVPLPVPFTRQALHAYRLGLVHPVTGRKKSWEAEPPEDLQALIDALDFDRYAEEDDEDEVEPEWYEGEADDDDED